MRIDLPICGFKNCKFSLDCNCIADARKRDSCEYLRILETLNEVEQMHLYKVLGDRDSYSLYNEGWQDCVDRIKSLNGME